MALHVNTIAILLAMVASYVFGAVWYTALGSHWIEALGTSKEKMKERHEGRLSAFVVTALAELLMAVVLAGFIGLIGTTTLRSGVLTALFCWLGFVLTTTEANHAFNGARHKLTLIDAGHWLGVMLIQGAVIGLMGV